MPNKEWDNATVEEKLDLLRADIQHISDYHNALGREVRQQTALVVALIGIGATAMLRGKRAP